MRILITGAAGRLGNCLKGHLASHLPIGADLGDFDVADFAAVNAFMADVRPEVVIHAAAWTDVDGCARDPEKAIRINGLGAQNIAVAAASVDAAVVYISTNEVFDGSSSRPYYEYDPTHPANPYGYSKWVGEQVIARATPRHYIARTSWLFAHGGRNFVQSILHAARDQRPLRVVTDEIASPTYTDDLADAIARLIETGRYGIYHLVNEGSSSRYDFARYVLDHSGYASTPIEPISMSQWQRASTPPSYSPLRNLAGSMIGVGLRDWQTAVDAFLEREGFRA